MPPTPDSHRLRRATHATAGLGLGLAALVAVAALSGIGLPVVYEHETASWAAQGVGQDWVNLVVVVPWLVLASLFSWRGSRRATLLLGGALVYTLYSYAIYAFGVHFNALFLVYCAALGVSCFALAWLLPALLANDVRAWSDLRAPIRLAGAMQLAVAVCFAGLWLAEIIPAIASGRTPASLSESGAFSNPVHVLDLSIFLPALVLSGLAALRRHPRGYVLTPILLGFVVLMATAIVGMMMTMRQRGVPVAAGLVAVLSGLAMLGGVLLMAILRSVRRGEQAPAPRSASRVAGALRS